MLEPDKSEGKIPNFCEIKKISKYKDDELISEIAHIHVEGPRREGIEELINFLKTHIEKSPSWVSFKNKESIHSVSIKTLPLVGIITLSFGLYFNFT